MVYLNCHEAVSLAYMMMFTVAALYIETLSIGIRKNRGPSTESWGIAIPDNMQSACLDSPKDTMHAACGLSVNC